MNNLFLGDSCESVLKINKNYADHYNTWRRKEEIQKLKDRYGEVSAKQESNSSNESSSSDEDENAEQLTNELEKDFFRTLSCLKKKDPSIYNENVSFFVENNSSKQHKSINNKKVQKEQMFLRDYERKLITEREGKLSDDEEDDSKAKIRPQSPTIAEEENLIKESFKVALKDSDDEDSKDKVWGGLFHKRHKTKEELEKEDIDYREWLKGQKDELTDKKTESELKYLHDYWNDPKLESDELFLKDYILNKRFLETCNDDDYIPTYEEIVHDSDENLSEDEKTIEQQEEFEHKFNFRFEEPDKEFIKRYPRTMENSLRKKDDRRKKKRQEIKDRKQVEEVRKRDELKRLKALKRKEIMEKIEKLKQITGNEELAFKEKDFEDDFDSAEHDKLMNQLFDSEYYQGKDSKMPVFPELDEELEIENWDEWTGRNDMTSQHGEEELHCEDPDFNMDCDYDPASQLKSELIKATKRNKKDKRKWSKFAQAVSEKKPVFDSNSRTFDEYFDEYYKLDFEDIIGDIPCRFKYRNVVPNSFGLTIDEILKADDKELNNWCSLKRTFKYRPEHIEKYDIQAYRNKAKNENLKKKVFNSFYTIEPTEQQTENKGTKRKRKHKHKIHGEGADNELCDVDRKINTDDINGESESQNDETASLDNNSQSMPPDTVHEQRAKKNKKKRKNKAEKHNCELGTSTVVSEKQSRASLFKKHRSNKDFKQKYGKKYRKSDHSGEQNSLNITDSRLRAYGINPKKFKNKLKYGTK